MASKQFSFNSLLIKNIILILIDDGQNILLRTTHNGSIHNPYPNHSEYLDDHNPEIAYHHQQGLPNFAAAPYVHPTQLFLTTVLGNGVNDKPLENVKINLQKTMKTPPLIDKELKIRFNN